MLPSGASDSALAYVRMVLNRILRGVGVDTVECQAHNGEVVALFELVLACSGAFYVTLSSLIRHLRGHCGFRGLYQQEAKGQYMHLQPDYSLSHRTEQSSIFSAEVSSMAH